ncbi:MAG: alpha/beta fold hydrolase [Oligoflexales bacterium]|nr:alpha/beta fold hydrolase [Oligoflexales bacterium]
MVRINLRGCGVGRHLSKEICHAGRSEDLFEIVKYFHKRYPHSRIHCIGFSLGGNLLLKMASLTSASQIDQLSSVVAVSPPIDLKSCVTYLGAASRRWLDYYFVKTLVKLSKEHPIPYKIPSKNIGSLYEFDNLITAKVAGFRDADEYYEFSSSTGDLDKLACPTLILSAQDDPCVDFSIFENIDAHSMVSFIGTE